MSIPQTSKGYLNTLQLAQTSATPVPWYQEVWCTVCIEIYTPTATAAINPHASQINAPPGHHTYAQPLQHFQQGLH